MFKLADPTPTQSQVLRRFHALLTAFALTLMASRVHAIAAPSDDEVNQLIIKGFCLIALSAVAVFLGVIAAAAKPGKRLLMVKTTSLWLCGFGLAAIGLLLALYANGAQDEMILLAAGWSVILLVVLALALSIHAFFASRRGIEPPP